MDTALTITPATPYDLSALYTLYIKLREEENSRWVAYEVAYPSFSLGEDDKREFLLERMPLLYSPSVKYLLAKDSSGLPVGYMLCSVFDRTIGTPKRGVFVHEMFVLAEQRAKGDDQTASLLVKTAKEWAKEQQCSVVEISCVSAKTMVDFWKGKGFTPFKVYLQAEIKE